MKKPSSILAIFLVTIAVAAVSSCTDEYTDAMPATPEDVNIDLKMEPDSTVLYGWIEVDIDTSTGAVSIKDQGIL